MDIKSWLITTNNNAKDSQEVSKELERFHYFASLMSKNFNEKGQMPIINFNSIDVIYQGPITFKEVVPINNNYQKETIHNLTSLMISLFLGKTDNLFSKEWINNNYYLYKDLLPNDDEPFYAEVINDEAIYYCDFKKNPKIIPIKIDDGSLNISRQNTYIKSTAAGRAFAEQQEHKAAFTNILLIPIILILVMLIIIIIYFYFYVDL